MDPLSAILLSTFFTGAIAVAREKKIDWQADWEALKRGETPPSQAWREELLKAHQDNAAGGSTNPLRLTPQQYRKLWETVGRHPGVKMALARAFHNAKANAKKRVSDHLDEVERRSFDPDHKAKVEDEKRQAKEQAEHQRKEWANRAKNTWNKGTKPAAQGWNLFMVWLKPDPADATPDPGAGPKTGDAPHPGADTNPGASRSRNKRREDTTDNGTWRRWHDTRAREKEAEQTREQRRAEYAEWVQGNRRHTGFTATPNEDPTTHTPPTRPGQTTTDAHWWETKGEIDQGKRALDPVPPPRPAPAATERPQTMPDNTTTRNALNNTADQSPTKGARAPATTQPGTGMRPTRSASPDRVNTSPSTYVTASGEVGLRSTNERLYGVVMTLENLVAEMNVIVGDYRSMDTGESLMEILNLGGRDLAAVSSNFQMIGSYMAAADSSGTAHKNEFTEAPKNLEHYGN